MSQCDTHPNVSAPQALVPLSFPLYGSRLIEASAGTGKTWTIAALYVRLVLAHGGTAAYNRALTPSEILVVTFTEAATQELRERIRARLTEAANAFLEVTEPCQSTPTKDEFLADLRLSYPRQEWLMCARKLQLAAESMDEAAVSTIHGWCNRMLREHAFDSNSLFTLNLESDQTELLAEVLRDYWRTFVVPLNPDATTELRSWWSGPVALQNQLEPLMAHADLLDTAQPPAISLGAAKHQRHTLLTRLKQPWLVWADQLENLLDGAVEHKQVDGRKIQPRFYRPWIDALRHWANDPDQVELLLTDTAWNRLAPEGLQEAWKLGQPPTHEAIDAIPELRAALSNLPSARQDVLCHAARWAANRYAADQAREAQMGFNDLLTGLDQALQDDGGQRLASTIRQQFPVVLIDEFQDTDPVQYRIFDAIYRVSDNNPHVGIILIGDPKQAIYAFRGADIYTYLGAKHDTAGRLYTLKTNFRSTTAMVGAVNRCFEVAENRTIGKGAFLFRDADGETNPLPFASAQARGRDQVFNVESRRQAALTVWQTPVPEDGRLKKSDCQNQMAVACASEIVRLLNLAQIGKAGFQEDALGRVLRPADMAVLVNNRTEADVVRRELTVRGVRSVYLSDQESVLQSPQAQQVYYWLSACAEPGDGRRLRAALATPTLGLSWEQLDALNHDEALWERHVVQFRAYRDCWRSQGVLPMLRRLLHDFDVPARLLHTENPAETGGERVLTDILHLAELLQQASTLIEGEHALIRYLLQQQQTSQSSRGNEALQLRLESDADLVKVVTVHKSKGLEYPLVFLPFAWNVRVTKPDDLPLKYHNEQGELQIALACTPDLLAQVDDERLAEDLRKLYVALTRARFATWIGFVPLADQERSALGYLLGVVSGMAARDMTRLLHDLAEDSEDIVVLTPPQSPTRLVPAPDPSLVDRPVLMPQRSVREHWWIASYSALADTASSTALGVRADEDRSPETSAQDVFDEALARPLAAGALFAPSALQRGSAQASAGLLHDFPRGPGPGGFLHDLLEWAANQGFSVVKEAPDLARDTIARRCAVRGWDQWIAPLTQWLGDFLSTPFELDAANADMSATVLSLSDLDHYTAEMEFWLAADKVGTAALDALVCAHTSRGMDRPALQPRHLNGMVKGFMDLVFECEGRYYIADYKSNWLGPDDQSYTRSAMEAVMLQSRYDLQYVLYLLALHRLLKARLADYDYDVHIGGAVYFFLRGLQAPGQGIYFDRPPRQLIESLDDLFSSVSSKGAK